MVSPFQAILDYEHKHSIAPGYVNYAIARAAPTGWWHQLERGEIPLDDQYYRGFKSDLEKEAVWQGYHQKLQSLAKGQTPASRTVPPVPNIDVENLFWNIMTKSKEPDPYMYPALQKLKASGKVKLAALSNTVDFPPGHPLGRMGDDGVRSIFEVFVSSSEVGMRKPDRNIYDFTMEKLRSKWGQDLQPDEVVFLDDIGQNLRMGRIVGFRTIKVILGKTDDAVRELEKVTGLELLEEDRSVRSKL